jgi:hypothetical protein
LAALLQPSNPLAPVADVLSREPSAAQRVIEMEGFHRQKTRLQKIAS